MSDFKTQVVVNDTNVHVITAGIQGPSGFGIAGGGATGQLLRKASASPFNTGWSKLTEGANGELSGYFAHINTQTGTSYTLAASDAGKLLRFTNGSAITLTLPNSLAAGFTCSVLQAGAGQVTCNPASGATRNNKSSFTKTSGQWAVITLLVDVNSGGTSAHYVLGGDGA